MKAVIQRVNYAKLEIENKLYSEINKGFLVFLGVADTDEQKQAELLCDKISKLRIFEDENQKMNKSLLDFSEMNYSMLVVSNFTLFADCKGQNRPYFIKAARPDKAKPLYDYFVKQVTEKYKIPVKTGVFGEDMQITLSADGPVTIILDTDEL